MLLASSTMLLPASIACVPTSDATRFTRATVDCLRLAGRRFFGAAAFFTRFTTFLTAFFAALRVAFFATLRPAFLMELLVRGPPRRRTLPFFAVRFFRALFFFVARFFRDPDLRAVFFLVAIRCAPRDEIVDRCTGQPSRQFPGASMRSDARDQGYAVSMR